MSHNDDPELVDALAQVPEPARGVILARMRPISRLDRRDEALRRLAASWYGDVDERHRPAAISSALDRELSMRSAPAPGSRREALREVLTLNGGAGLSRHQVRNVLCHRRSSATFF